MNKYICIKEVKKYPGFIGVLNGDLPITIVNIGDIKDIHFKNEYCKVDKNLLTYEDLEKYFIPLSEWREDRINKILDEL